MLMLWYNEESIFAWIMQSFWWTPKNWVSHKIWFSKTIDVATLIFATKIDLTNLKSDVNVLDIDKLKTIHTNLRNLKSEVYKLDVLKYQVIL